MSQVFCNTFRKNLYSSGSSFSNSFAPIQLLNCKLWLSPDGYARSFEVGGANLVSNWADKSIIPNLLTYSEQFDHANWGKIAVTVAGDGYLAPDGSTNADCLMEDNTTTFHELVQQVTSPNGTYTATVHVAPNGRNFAWLSIDGGTTGYMFNVSTGAIGAQTGSGNTPNVSKSDNGYWRIAVTKSGVTNPYFALLPSNDGVSLSYAGSNTNALNIFGAQISRTGQAITYAPTTSAAITSNDASQATSANRPTYNTGGANGFPYLGYDGAATYLLDNTLSIPTGSSTQFFVVDPTTTTGNQALLASFDGVKQVAICQSTFDVNGNVGWYDGSWHDIDPSTTGAQILTFALTTGANNALLYRNGAALGSPATAAGSVIDGSVVIGANFNGLSGWLLGKYYETAIYSVALSTINRRRLERYLGKKYTITVT